MIRCINQATILPTDTLKFFELARKHSFPAVELDIGKVEECVGRVGLPSLQKTIRESGLQVVSLNAIENYPILTRDDMVRSLRRCEEVINLSSSMNCNIVVVNPNEVAGAERANMAGKFDEFMNQARTIAENHNVRLGFEYVSYDNRIIHTLVESLDGLHRWSSGIGLVLDVFHMYRSGEKIRAIPTMDSHLLWAFHVNDAPNTPISVLRDSDRLMPLEGVMNLREYVRDLQAVNFKGPISVELFNKKYWEMDPDSVIAKAKTSLDELGV
jgi:2-keto-myo-inositol isomerase